MQRIDRRAVLRLVAVAVASLVRRHAGDHPARDRRARRTRPQSIIAAVVATAFVAGTWGAIVAAVAAFILYDFLFVLPLYTLTVEDPERVAEPRRPAVHRDRRRPARRDPAVAHGDREGPRARGAGAVPGQSRACDPRVHARGPARASSASCATRPRWRASGSRSVPTTPASGWQRTPSPIDKAGLPGIYNVLQRTPDETPARWRRVHLPTATARGRGRRQGGLPGPDRGRRTAVRVDLGEAGSRPRRAGPDGDAAAVRGR